MSEKDVPGIRKYDAPAGGWGALRATAKAVSYTHLTLPTKA